MQKLVSKNQEQDQAEVNFEHLMYIVKSAVWNPIFYVLLTGGDAQGFGEI